MFKSFLLAILLTVGTSSTRAFTCAPGENQMSIEGLDGVFCVIGDICMGTNGLGACPATQEGLPYGSYCGVVASGVFGCKPSSAPTKAPIEDGSFSGSDDNSGVDDADTTEPPTTELATTTTPVTAAPYVACSDTTLTVSVQGLQNAFCVNEPACVSNVSTGNCPGPQPGLEFGSYCDLLKTDAYGCKPYSADNQPSNVTYNAPLDCSNNPAGDTPVSIVGSETDFCAPEPVCSGSIFGNCPHVQDGLTQDSECMVVKTGVYGCVFMAST